MIHLVIGGARSGKSSFAEKQAQTLLSKTCTSKNVLYIATATANDEEMASRIKHHQQMRPKEWLLEEEFLILSSLIKRYHNNDFILLIECMTLWITNWLCGMEVEKWPGEKEAFFQALLKSQQGNSKTDIIIVSNEVGSGIIPMGELSRDFIDQAGWLNQELAKIADKVTLVVAGCSITLKNEL